MNGGMFARLQSQEPALLSGLYTLVGGFVAQTGPGHLPALKSLGTSVTISGLQSVLTRERVVSPATAKSGGGGGGSSLASLVAPWLAQGAEPALAMSLVGFIAGFLVQLVGGGTNLLQMLGIAAGLSGTQGVITRQQVFSPRSIAMSRLASAAGVPAMVSAPVAGPAPPAGVPAPAAVTPVSRPPAPASSPTAVHPDPAQWPGLISLLQRYRPEVRYDSLESYYADSAAIITDRTGNLLKRQDGSIIAASSPAAGQAKLTLGFLGAHQYGNGQPVAQSDYIDIVGSDYVAQAHQMHAQPGYADRVHGRVVIDSAGSRWLQYWFFMYYDDPSFLGLGTHEGDLEMIQLRLDANGQPDAASYSQHRSGVRATWSQLELASSPDGPVPVTYSARGSHANLLRPGQSISTRSFLPDHNDGHGYRVRPDLVVLSDTDAPWCLWPGSWGGTHATGVFGDIGISANSPTAANRHLAWRDPAGFHNSCDVPDDLPPPGTPTGLTTQAPPAPQLSVQRSANAAVVSYQLPAAAAGAPAPAKLVVGVAPTDRTAPAITKTVEVSAASGTVELPLPPGGTSYEVRATTHADSGVGSATARAPFSSS